MFLKSSRNNLKVCSRTFLEQIKFALEQFQDKYQVCSRTVPEQILRTFMEQL